MSTLWVFSVVRASQREQLTLIHFLQAVEQRLEFGVSIGWHAPAPIPSAAQRRG